MSTIVFPILISTRPILDIDNIEFLSIPKKRTTHFLNILNAQVKDIMSPMTNLFHLTLVEIVTSLFYIIIIVI